MLIFFIILLVFQVDVSSTSGKSPIVRQPDGFFRCPNDPITLKYADPEDKYCIHYFMCHLSHAFPMKCPLRKVFHPAIGECIPRTEVPEEVCPFEIKCGFNGYYPDPKDCTRYYICFYQQPSHFACSQSHVFNPRKSLCEKNAAKAAECSKQKPLPQFTPRPTKPISWWLSLTTPKSLTSTTSTKSPILITTTKSGVQKRSEPVELDPSAYGEQRVFIL